jgi:hypothetical protein
LAPSRSLGHLLLHRSNDDQEKHRADDRVYDLREDAADENEPDQRQEPTGGLDAKRTRLPVCIMALLVTTVILLIFDLDRPSSGYITNNQQSMIDTAASIAAFSD